MRPRRPALGNLRRRRSAVAVVWLGAAGLSAGCAGDQTTLRPSTTDSILLPDTASIAAGDTIGSVVDVGNAKQPRPYDAALALAIVDNQRWWATVFPDLYDTTYTPLSGKVYASYPGRTAAIPGCSGAEQTSAEELAGYVALYCADRDFFAYDDGPDSELLRLTERYSTAAVAVVISHEWAHAVQNRIGTFERDLPTVYTEQHADCVAGAWVARAREDESALVRFDATEVADAVATVAEVRDPVGADRFDDDAHGSAFDRVGAFQTGYTDGVAACADLLDNPLPAIGDESDRDDELGDRAASTVDAASVARDLNDFWRRRQDDFPELAPPTAQGADCADGVAVGGDVIVCSASATVVDGAATADQRNATIGDFAAGYLYAVGWSEIALGAQNSSLTGERRALARDCLAGLWIADIAPGADGTTDRNGVALSAGDLDEVVDIVIEIADDSPLSDSSLTDSSVRDSSLADSSRADSSVRDSSVADSTHPAGETDRLGDPIEKIEAIRTGIFEDGCDRYLSP